MSLLPTAHAGQAFGSRRIDFFTVSGQVASSSGSTGHVTDADGMDHEIKLMEQTSALAPGDTATVLRVQSGPNRRSRPVAIINHSRGVWMRAAPDATSTLSKSGVTRTINWWLSMLVLLIVGAASVWPTIHAFISVVSDSLMTSVPMVDIFAELNLRMPGLASWRMEDSLTTGMRDGLEGLGFVPMNLLTEWSLGIGVALLAIIAFSARSWRLIYIPALAALSLVGGAVLGSADVTVMMIAGALVIFAGGGLINRIRDGGRFNARVDRLAEHVMRHPPQEGVVAADTSKGLTKEAAMAAAAIATAAAIAEGNQDAEAAPHEPDDEPLEADTSTPVDLVSPALETTDTATDGASDTDVSIEAVVDDNLMPGNAETANDGTSDDTEAVIEDVSLTTAAEAPGPSAASSNADIESTVTTDATDFDDAKLDEDEDLPDANSLAAAIALNAAEAADGDVASVPEDDSAADAERTMVLAPPPPMPISEEPNEDDIQAIETSESDSSNDVIPVEIDGTEDDEAITEQVEPSTEPADIETSDQDSTDPEMLTVDPVDSESEETSETESVDVLYDDPLIDDAGDPMTDAAVSGDFAPGAPDIKFDD